MGRKIPGRKHRGVKDIEKQRAERFAKIKDKVNTAPTNVDEQQIPSTLSRLIELKNKTKEGQYDKKNKNKIKKGKENNSHNGKPEKNIPKFERRVGESDREFKRRMNRICTEVVKEAAFENKYQVDIKRNEDGEVEGVVKRPKDELEQFVKKIKKERNQKKSKKGKKKAEEGAQPKLSKQQKWALKKKEKKEKKITNREEDYNLQPKKEIIKFGEVVHAPPNLVAPRRVDKNEGASRPGQKELLLKSLLPKEKQQNLKKGKNKKEEKLQVISNQSKTINKKGKRKDLPNALRRTLDKQQSEVIEAYKKIKLQRRANS
ncbi:coiled-coil domain-containing protein 137 [Anthonomus grandis grandis]|uniref:coiled-coil domain-containing protein 137 n=1 Tax=Anthonomus grandis grandis TaxID=2921223 RepID=UPI0021653FE3|nr:coiled-coil domain-containing protein 137 [Anthonomus grandis grandis]